MVSQIVTEQITESQNYRIYWLERTHKNHWVNGEGVLAHQGFGQADWGRIADEEVVDDQLWALGGLC